MTGIIKKRGKEGKGSKKLKRKGEERESKVILRRESRKENSSSGRERRQ